MTTHSGPLHRVRVLPWGAVLWLSLGLFLPALLFGSPAAGPATQPSHRYLLVVDVSQSMSSRARNTLKALEDLLKSGMNGRMRDGDTLGIWTFNSQLYAGRFPLQRWSILDQAAIAERALVFLKQQKYGNRSDLQQVLAPLERVVKDSELITVILVSAGEGMIRGTPFDERINEFWSRWQEKQKGGRMPLIVLLLARQGQITGFTLNRPPWPIQLPALYSQTERAALAPGKSTQSPRPAEPARAPAMASAEKNPKPLAAPKVAGSTVGKSEGTVTVQQAEPVAKESPAAPLTRAAEAKPKDNEATMVKPETTSAPPVATAKPAEPVRTGQTKPTPTRAASAANDTGAAPHAKPAPERPATQMPPPEPSTAKATSTNASPALMAQKDNASIPDSKPVGKPELKTIESAPPKPAPAATPQVAKTEATKAVEPKAAVVPAARVSEAPSVAPSTKPEVAPAPTASTPPIQTAPPTNSASVPASLSAATDGVKVTETKRLTAAPVQPANTAALPAPKVEAVNPSPSKPPVQPAVQVTSPTPPPTPVGPANPVVAPAATAAATSLKPKPEEAAAPPATREVPPLAPASPTADSQNATAIPPEALWGQRATWIVGFLLAGAALGYGLLAWRRARATPRGSLITRSLDRKQKR